MVDHSNSANVLVSSDQAGPSHNESQQHLSFYPFAYCLYSENLTKYCWYCLDDEKTHKRCSGCSSALFCDKDCQSLAWKDHKFECRGIKRHNGTVPDIEVRLLGRIVARHKAILTGYDKKDPNFYKDRKSRRNLMDIWAHTTSISNDPFAMKKFNDIYERLCAFYDPKAMLPKQMVFEVHCRDFINRHAISDKDYFKEIGKGLYLDLCAYDHSCRPNTIYICKSFVAILRPLHTGVNLLDRSSTFYSYVDLLCAKQDRRKLLKDTWYFNCECERCVDQSEHALSAMLCPHCEADSPTTLCIFGENDYKDPETQLITCPRCKKLISQERVVEAISAMRFINDILDKTDFNEMGRERAVEFLEDLLVRFKSLLPRVNVYYCKLIQALIPLVDPGESRKLLSLHREAEDCVRICYPQNHPAVAFHLRNIGIFSRNVGKLKQAVDYLREALRILDFVMGNNHSLAESTRVILHEVEEEETAFRTASLTVDFGKISTEIKGVLGEETQTPKIEIIEEVEEVKTSLENVPQIIDSSQNVFETKTLPTLILPQAEAHPPPESFNLKVEDIDYPQTSQSARNALDDTLKDENELMVNVNPKINEESLMPQSSLRQKPKSASSSLSPQDTGTGVKKKATMKKASPRARTPRPLIVRFSNDEEDDDESIGSRETPSVMPLLALPNEKPSNLKSLDKPSDMPHLTAPSKSTHMEIQITDAPESSASSRNTSEITVVAKDEYIKKETSKVVNTLAQKNTSSASTYEMTQKMIDDLKRDIKEMREKVSLEEPTDLKKDDSGEIQDQARIDTVKNDKEEERSLKMSTNLDTSNALTNVTKSLEVEAKVEKLAETKKDSKKSNKKNKGKKKR